MSEYKYTSHSDFNPLLYYLKNFDFNVSFQFSSRFLHNDLQMPSNYIHNAVASVDSL